MDFSNLNCRWLHRRDERYGGGIILIPALTLLGLDAKHSIAVSIVSVIATSSGSASAYVRDKITNLKFGMFLEMFTIVGAIAGAAITLASWVALLVQRRMPEKLVTQQDRFSKWLELSGSYYDQASHETISYKANRATLARG